MRFAIICLLLIAMLPATAQHFLIPLPKLSERIAEFSTTANESFHTDSITVQVEERITPKKFIDKYNVTVYKEKFDSAYRAKILHSDCIVEQLKRVPDSAIITDWLMPDMAESFAYRVIKHDTIRHNDTVALTLRLGNGNSYVRLFSVTRLIDKAEDRISFEDEEKIGAILSTLRYGPAGKNYNGTGMNAWNSGACPSCIEFYGYCDFIKPADKIAQQECFRKVKALLEAGSCPNLPYEWKCTSINLEHSDSSYIEYKAAIILK